MHKQGPAFQELTAKALSVLRSALLLCGSLSHCSVPLSALSLPWCELPEGRDATAFAFVFLAPDFNTTYKYGLSKCWPNVPLKILEVHRTMV